MGKKYILDKLLVFIVLIYCLELWERRVVTRNINYITYVEGGEALIFRVRLETRESSAQSLGQKRAESE